MQCYDRKCANFEKTGKRNAKAMFNKVDDLEAKSLFYESKDELLNLLGVARASNPLDRLFEALTKQTNTNLC